MRRPKHFVKGSLLVLGILLLPRVMAGLTAQGQATAVAAIDNTKVALDTVWTLLTAFLVFFMNLGFALVESGMC